MQQSNLIKQSGKKPLIGLTKEDKKSILENRLNVLSMYLEKGNGRTFSQFAMDNGINKNDFIKDLPDSLKNPPANGGKKLLDYMDKMNQMYVGCFSGISMGSDGIYTLTSNLDNKKGVVPVDTLPGEAVTFNAAGGAWVWGSDRPEDAPFKGINTTFFRNPSGNIYNENNRLNLSSFGDGRPNRAWYGYPRPYQYPITDMSVLTSLDNTYQEDLTAWLMAYDPDAFIREAPISDPSKKGFLNKAWELVKKAGKIVRQDVRSIVEGLQQSPKEIFEDIGNEFKRIDLHKANKYNPAAVVIRTAFLSLMDINLLNIAKAYNYIKTDSDKGYWNRILTRWDVLGGSESQLSSAINKGKDKQPPFQAVFDKFFGGKMFNAIGGVTDEQIKQAQEQAAKVQKIIEDSKKAQNQGNIAAGVVGATAGGLAAATTMLLTIPELAASKAAAVWTGSASGVMATMYPVLKDFAKSKGLNLPEVPPIPTKETNPENPKVPNENGSGSGNGSESSSSIDMAKTNRTNIIIAGTIGTALLIGAVIVIFKS